MVRERAELERSGEPWILLVDDDAEIRHAAADALREEGYAVLTAAGGEEALWSLLAAEPGPALIILDLVMPGMNGWQFREHQLRDCRARDIPVIILTAHRGGTPTLDLYGPDELLRKPIRLDDLLAAIGRFVPLPVRPQAPAELGRRPGPGRRAVASGVFPIAAEPGVSAPSVGG